MIGRKEGIEMKKIYVFCIIIIFIITGCSNNKNDLNNNLDDNMTYIDMNEQLIEYGNEILEELGNSNEKVDLFVSLDELSNKYNYDISIFVNKSDGKLCDTKTSGVFIKKDDTTLDDGNVSSKLLCDDGSDLEVDSLELYKHMIKYLNDIYNNDNWMNGEVEPSVNVVTLRELKEKGYDISMFINKKTNKLCDLDLTRGIFEIFGINEDGTTNYEYRFDYKCDVK